MFNSSGRQSSLLYIYHCNKQTSKLIVKRKKKLQKVSIWARIGVGREAEVSCWWCVCVAPSFSPGTQLGYHSSARCGCGLHGAPEPHAADDGRCISRPAHPGHPASPHQRPGHPTCPHQCPGHPASTHWHPGTAPCYTHGHTGAAACTHWCPAATRRHQDLG